MSNIATSINQSQKLIELGIDVNTADMHYSKWDNNDEEEEYHLKCGGLPMLDFKYAKNIPAWSLSRLLELIPDLKLSNVCIDKWILGYYSENGWLIKESNFLNTPLDAAFEMVCYLLENKLI